MNDSRTGTTRTRRDFIAAAGGSIALAAGTPGLAAGSAPKREAAPAPPPRRRPLRLGLASYSLRKFNLTDTVAMTRRVGLPYLCLKSFHLPLKASPEEIAKAAAEVKAAGLTLYGGGVIRMRDEAGARHAFAYAKAAGMTTIVGVPAPAILPLVDALVKQHDIAVAIHNHGPGDTTYPTPATAYEKIKHLDRRIGLCMDVGHTVRVGADPISSAEKYADRLLDVHIKDVTAAAPNGRECEIGRGVIDVPKLLRTLVKIAYAGIVSFEYEKDATDPLAGLAESVGYVNGVLDTL
jgi:sugar phosphate isomerase/epimerase